MPKQIGPLPARIMLVDSCYRKADMEEHKPFSGFLGQELGKLLAGAGIRIDQCYCTWAIKAFSKTGGEEFFALKKKDETPVHLPLHGKPALPIVHSGLEGLVREIEQCQPNIVIAFGNAASFILTGKWGVQSWRASTIPCALSGLSYSPKVFPIQPIGRIMWDEAHKPIMQQDLRRAAGEARTRELILPKYKFLVRPDFQTALGTLEMLLSLVRKAPLKLAVDIETRFYHIACIQLGWSPLDAICIPLMCVERKDGYWSEDEEVKLMWNLYLLLTHPNCQVIGQNFHYDAQYFFRYLLFIPRLQRDTMIAQHSMFSTMEKGLGFLSSMYCKFHVYWKDEGKEWTPDIDEDQLWEYGCKDACITYEVDSAQQLAVDRMGLRAVHDFQQALWWPVLETMIRGLRVDKAERQRFANLLFEEIAQREAWLYEVLGETLNIRSPQQMQELFYKTLGQKPVVDKITRRPTTDEEALGLIAEREPLLLPITRKISELRSLGVFLSTFIRAPLDIDGKMRCMFKIPGTKTYRFASAKNAFGTGANLQNIPSGGEDSGLVLPNIRTLFIPDPGHEYFDIDLSAADLRIVVWESDCREMKAMLRAGLDPYTEIAKEFYHDPGITKKDPRRQTFKSFAHGCLTAGHEVLTPKGWVDISEYEEETPLAVWEPKNWSIWFERPNGMVRDFGVHFVSFEGQSYECEVTHDHRIPYTTDTVMRVGPASAIPKSARLPMCGYLDGALLISVEEARLLAAFQADGSLDNYGNVTFHFHRQRKMRRMRELLDAYIPRDFSEYKDGFYIPREAANFAQWGKIAGAYLLNWDADALDAFLEELVHWDGNGSGTILCHVTTTVKEHADWLQTIAKLRGYGSQVNLQRPGDRTRKALWRVSLNKRQYFNLSAGKKSEVYETSPRAVYCPKTSTGYFMVRKNGKIFITGNTNYLGTAKGLAQRLGLSVKEAESTQAWYFGKFPEIKRWQERLRVQTTTRRMVQNIFGYRLYVFDRIEGTKMNEVVAWIPQSTVGCLINRIYMKIYQNLREVQVLLQVHDSLAGQYPIAQAEWCRKRILEEAVVELPYDDPLVIPVGIKVSTKSWGDCK